MLTSKNICIAFGSVFVLVGFLGFIPNPIVSRYCQMLWIEVIRRRPVPVPSLAVLPLARLVAHP